MFILQQELPKKKSLKKTLKKEICQYIQILINIMLIDIPI